MVSPIGAGGMGEVYRAQDSKLGRDVAIKVLPEALAHDPERLIRFQREAKMLAALNHPNIATIYGMEQSSGTSYLVMELVPGDTLADRIERDGAIPVEESLAIAKQIAEALEAAHEKGIVHRDLKPANVKVTSEGKVKVLDFGLAKAFEDDPAMDDVANSPTLTMAATMQGTIMGTAAYMSPEQARGKPVDRRADIWAFGVVLYEMLTGHQLFAGDTVSDTLAAVLRHEPDYTQVPERARRLLRWCLEKNPKNRLRDIADGMVLLESSPDSDATPQSANSGPVWLWAVATAGCLAAVILAVLHFREKPAVRQEPVSYQIRLPDKVTFSQSGNFTISPDSRHIAFSASGPDGVSSVWIQDLGALEARPLPDTVTGPNPPPFFWSPDSRYVAYSRVGLHLRKADIQGGATVDVSEERGPAIGGSWNKDGVIIIGSNRDGLWRVSADGGTPVPLTVLDTSRQEFEHELPNFLPDGRHFIYLRVSKSPQMSGIYLGSLDDLPERQNNKMLIATGFGAIYAPAPSGGPGNILFLRQDTLLAQTFDPDKLELLGEPYRVATGIPSIFETGYFSATSNLLVYRTTSSLNAFGLVWFDREGKPLGSVGEASDIARPRLSPDGTRVVYAIGARTNTEEDIWVHDLARGVSSRLTFGGSLNNYPLWSPDGSEIVFSSNREGRYNLYRKLANGAKEEELLLRSDENKRPESWSRDGRYLLYATSKSNFSAEQLWVLPMQGDRTPFPFSRTRFDETTAEFSPDGRWIAYATNETGTYEVYVREFTPPPGANESGGKWQISKDGGVRPLWRSDGKEMSYVDPTTGRQMSVSLDYIGGFHAGAPHTLFEKNLGGIGITATPDLKRFLIVSPAQQKGPQVFDVMANWTAGLKK